MSASRLPGIVAALVATVALAIAVVATSSRVGSPSSAATLVAAADGGALVGSLPGIESTLRDGDVVTAVAGRPVGEWLAAQVTGAVPPLPIGVGDAVDVDLVRDGAALRVSIVARPYPTGDVLVASAGTLAFVFAFFVLAVVIFVLRPANHAAGAFLVAGAGAAGSTVPFLLGLDVLDVATGRAGTYALATLVVYLLLWAGAVDFALTFPRPFPALARRPVLRLVPYAVTYGGYALATVAAIALSPDPLSWYGTLIPVQLLVILGAFVAIVVLSVRRWRAASAEDRRILRGIGIAGGFTIVASVVAWVLPELLTGRPLVPWTVAGILGLPLVLAVAAAILRHGAFDIDVVVRRSIVYSGAFVGVVAVYALSVSALSNALGAGGSFAAQLLSAGIAAIAALPIRDVVQRGVVQLLYGDRDEPVVAIRRLGERMTWAADPRAMPGAVVETVAGALRSPYVGLELGPPGEARMAAEVGDPVADPEVLPLVHRSRPVGRLLVAPRSPVDPFSTADLELLGDLARQIAAAAAAALLAEDLQRSRERIVAAGEDERRRLRRDLHDGLGPTLVAIGMRAEAVAARLADDPQAARAELDRRRAAVDLAVADVRRVVDGLRPPAVDEVGLVAALRLAADRLSAGGEAPDLVIESTGALPPLPAAVEVAAYRIATEAMTNTARHASATRCTVRLEARDGPAGDVLTIHVADDGIGLRDGIVEGVGLSSMRERAAELGGDLGIEAPPGGGTTILATIPLGPPTAGAGRP